MIKRAEEILESLELRRDLVSKGLDIESRDQMNLFGAAAPPAAADDELRAALREFDPDRSTPLQALQLVQDLRSKLQSRERK